MISLGGYVFSEKDIIDVTMGICSGILAWLRYTYNKAFIIEKNGWNKHFQMNIVDRFTEYWKKETKWKKFRQTIFIIRKSPVLSSHIRNHFTKEKSSMKYDLIGYSHNNRRIRYCKLNRLLRFRNKTKSLKSRNKLS